MATVFKPTYNPSLTHSKNFPDGNRFVLGTAGLGGVWGKIDANESVETLLYALDNGIRVLDTAPAYGYAQEYIGQALQQWKGELPFISTKCGRLRSNAADLGIYDYTPEAIRRSVENSLDVMGLPAVDILFLHDPEAIALNQLPPALEAMQALKAEGLAKRIGLGGNYAPAFEPFIKKENFDVVMLYNQVDASTLHGMEAAVPQILAEGIALYLGSPLHMGLLGNRFAAMVAGPAPEWITPTCITNAQKVKTVADRMGISLSTLAHRFLFSVAEADRIVVGSKNLTQLKATWSDYQAGVLPQEIFEEVVSLLLSE